MSLHQRLKEQTLSDHRFVESLAPSHQIMEGTVTAEQYADFLLANFYFHREIETRLDNYFRHDPIPELDFPSRRKLPFIQADLEALGITAIPEIGVFSFEFASRAEAFGSMYVTEGSMLGGAVIARALQAIPGAQFPVNFYTCYGSELGARWKSFLSVLGQALPPESEKPLVDAAKRAFAFFAQCMRWRDFTITSSHPE